MICDTLNPALIILMILAAAGLSPLVGRIAGAGARWVLAVIPLAAFAYLVAAAAPVWGGVTWRGSIPWATELGIDWDLWVSPLGLLLALLVTGIGTLVTIYAGGYLAKDPNRGRFFAFLFLFMGAMLGLALTENLIVLFLFWEMTSISSYLLIGYYHAKLEARKSALDALLVTAGGGVALLAGIILLGQIGGSYRIGELVAQHDLVVAHALYPAAFFCVLAGAVTKSAQFPFHFWLPGAMAAPAPVSSYLHSATMVKAGVFLLAVMHPVLGGTPLWHYSLMVIGTVTMTWAALVAVVQTDLKRLLAYTTASALGMLVMLLGIESASGAKAAMIFLIVHAFYKGALFMVAGILEKTTGTREITQLRGLVHTMPVLGIAAALAALSMSGIPPFIGFIAKELIYEVKLEDPAIGWPLMLCGVLANAANIVVALKVGIAPFLKSSEDDTPLKMSPGIGLVLGPVVLGFGGLLFGLFPGIILDGPLAAIVGQIRMEPFDVKLALWHGVNT
ncbi:MAG: proton-conducting transporter membrane subunit, partial [Verrucomicrobiales bacterium]